MEETYTEILTTGADPTGEPWETSPCGGRSRSASSQAALLWNEGLLLTHGLAQVSGDAVVAPAVRWLCALS